MTTTVRTRLVVDIEYDIGDRSAEEARSIIRCMLEGAANHLAGEGLLTGDTDLEVTSWEAQVLPGRDNCIPVESGQMQNWDRNQDDAHPSKDASWRLRIDRLGARDAVCVTVNAGPEDDPAPGLGLMIEIDKGRPRMMVSLGEHSDNLLDIRSVVDSDGVAKLAAYPDGNAVAVEACADSDGWVGRSYAHRPC